MNHYQEIKSLDNKIYLIFEFNNYVVLKNKKEYNFVNPNTVDDFINDMKRLNINLLWNKNVFSKFGI